MGAHNAVNGAGGRNGAARCVGLALAVGAMAGALAAREPAGPRTDLQGDPLPAGALARLGTVRWRSGSPVHYLAFTPDGKSLLTATRDNAVRLLDVATGRVLQGFEERPAGRGLTAGAPLAMARRLDRRLGGAGVGGSVALSPDGKALATAEADNSIRLWAVATGRMTRLIEGPAEAVTALLFSPDGKTLAARSLGSTLYLWDTATGEEVRRLRPAVNGFRGFSRFLGDQAGSLAFSADGKWLATAVIDQEDGRLASAVKILATATGEVVRRFAVPQTEPVLGVAFSPDGATVAYGALRATHLVDLDTGKELCRIAGTPYGASLLVFAPDGKTVVLRHLGDAAVNVHEVPTGRLVRRLGAAPGTTVRAPLGAGGFAGTGRDVAFSPDGKLLAAAGGGMVRLWDATTYEERDGSAGHRAGVTALAVAPDGRLVTSAGADDAVRLWDAATGRPRNELRAPGGVLAVSPDGRTCALGLGGGVVLRDVATGREVRRFAGHPQGVAALAFSPDGKLLASRGRLDETIRICDVAAGHERRQIALRPAGPSAPGVAVVLRAGGPTGGPALVFSPDGKLVASPVAVAAFRGVPQGGPAGTLALWDVATGKEVRRIGLPPGEVAAAIAFAPDGRTVATEGPSGIVTVWEVAGGGERTSFRPPAPPGVAPAPAARQATLRRPSRARRGPSPAALVFAPDGRTLAASGPERATHLWDVASGAELGRLAGHAGAVTALAVSADGRTLFSGSSDTTILAWDLARFGPRPRPAPADLSGDRLESLWADLAVPDAARAFRAINDLAAAPGRAVPFLRPRLRAASPLEPGRLDRLIAGLDSPRYAARQEAARELERLGELALPALHQALARPQSLETHRRLQGLAEKVAGFTLSADELRLVRAVEVLERAGTAEARAVLSALARGAPGALVTREAEAALGRLTRRP